MSFLIGPFATRERYALAIDGYIVPNVYATKAPDDHFYVHLERDGIPWFGTGAVTEDDINRWLPLLANAMANAAGYTCHGENSQKLHPYNCKIGELASNGVNREEPVQ